MNNQPRSTAPLGESFTQFVSANQVDDKGREIGFVVGFRDNGSDFYAWVQQARKTSRYDWIDFGPHQRSKRFDSQTAARQWAFSSAKDRISKIRK